MATADEAKEEAVPPAFAATALALTVQDWSTIGLSHEDDEDDIEDEQALQNSLIERLTSILLVRVVALTAPDRSCFPDLSTSSICRTVLMQGNPWSFYAPGITEEFLDQLRLFVRTILDGYHHTPYHCSEHAFHVACSANKLLDLILHTDPDTTKTFGIRSDPLTHFALLFSALVHDVEHKGVPNRQLVVENDPLAVLYNDESVAEQRSVFIGFDQLLRPEFKVMRETIFGGPEDGTGEDSYRRFRKLVIGLVLNTDIASAERTQLGKSKWKEAFGDTFESIERKLKKEMSRRNVVVDEDSFNEDSVSGTPESSDTEDEDTGTGSNTTAETALQMYLNAPAPSVSHCNDDDRSQVSGLSYNKFRPEHMKRPRGGRRPSTLSMPSSRRNSTQLLKSDDEYKAKFQRRMSSYSNAGESVTGRRPSNFRKRLGIRRSMDLGGEALEMYRRETTLKDLDEPDEFRALVVLETVLTAADVAHNLQGWDQMVIWSGRLYLELRKAYVEGRGADPRNRWFENQIGFLESYLLPLAHKLEDTGVFGNLYGPMFATIIEQNRDKWYSEGQEVADAIIAEGDEIFNLETCAEERMKISKQTRETGKGFSLKFRGTNLTVLNA